MLGYVYPATYLLLLPEAIDIQQLERFSALSMVAIKPVWKMSKSLREPPYGQWAVHGDWIDVNLQAYSHVSIAIPKFKSDLILSFRLMKNWKVTIGFLIH